MASLEEVKLVPLSKVIARAQCEQVHQPFAAGGPMRRAKGQSMVEYAIGIGAVSALCMVALGNLGFINWHILHKVEHAVKGASVSHHASSVMDNTATPWSID
jgi:hypothetical protein